MKVLTASVENQLELNYARPAAATSNALFALFCPFTFLKSILYFVPLANILSKSITSLSICNLLFKKSITSFNVSTPITSMFCTIAASLAFSLGSIIFFIPSFDASSVSGNTPIHSVYFSI